MMHGHGRNQNNITVNSCALTAITWRMFDAEQNCPVVAGITKSRTRNAEKREV
jgi:hypothetical protein